MVFKSQNKLVCSLMCIINFVKNQRILRFKAQRNKVYTRCSLFFICSLIITSFWADVCIAYTMKRTSSGILGVLNDSNAKVSALLSILRAL